jgi:hypothetical protein
MKMAFLLDFHDLVIISAMNAKSIHPKKIPKCFGLVNKCPPDMKADATPAIM